jgi:hypothetical protein
MAHEFAHIKLRHFTESGKMYELAEADWAANVAPKLAGASTAQLQQSIDDHVCRAINAHFEENENEAMRVGLELLTTYRREIGSALGLRRYDPEHAAASFIYSWDKFLRRKGLANAETAERMKKRDAQYQGYVRDQAKKLKARGLNP